jgi:hypothetical protein
MPPAARLNVRLIPRADRDEIAGARAGAALVRVSAAPVGIDGAGTEDARRLLGLEPRH